MDCSTGSAVDHNHTSKNWNNHGRRAESEAPQRSHGGCRWVCSKARSSQYEPCAVFIIVHASPLPSTQMVAAPTGAV